MPLGDRQFTGHQEIQSPHLLALGDEPVSRITLDETAQRGDMVALEIRQFGEERKFLEQCLRFLHVSVPMELGL